MNRRGPTQAQRTYLVRLRSGNAIMGGPKGFEWSREDWGVHPRIFGELVSHGYVRRDSPKTERGLWMHRASPKRYEAEFLLTELGMEVLK